MSSHNEENNFILNLLSNIEQLKSSLSGEGDSSIAPEPALEQLTDKQREAVWSLLEILSSGFEKYSNTDYGCCQSICDVEACYDLPVGYTEDQLSLLLTFSNLGINKIPSNSQIKKWYNSVDNNLAKALSNHYSIKVVDWLFETFGLNKPTNANYEHLTYSLSAFILYIVFGDSTVILEAFSGLLEEDSLDKVLTGLAKDVFAQDVNSWEEILNSFNDSVAENLPESEKEKYIVEKSSVYEIARWILTDLQTSLNQASTPDDCGNLGTKFPSFPSFLWVLTNLILATGISFAIAGARGRFGKTATGGIKWKPPFGPKDTLNEEFMPLFVSTASPFSGFAVKNVYVENAGLGPIVVHFNEEVSSPNEQQGFDFNHISLNNTSSYDVILEEGDSTEAVAFDIVAHPSERDKVQLIITSNLPDSGVYSLDWTLKIAISKQNVTNIYNDSPMVDVCAPWTSDWTYFGDHREVAIEGGSSGPTFSDFMAFASSISTEDFGATFGKMAAYLIDWHNRNFGAEMHDAFIALQSLGWMNMKGSDFAGFLHPDSACGPFIEQLICDYFDTLDDEECINIKLEPSCGVFSCDGPNNIKWGAECDSLNKVIVTRSTLGTMGTNNPLEAGFLFNKVDSVRSHNVEDGVSLCVIECPECGEDINSASGGCTPKEIAELEDAMAAATEMREAESARNQEAIEYGTAGIECLNSGGTEDDCSVGAEAYLPSWWNLPLQQRAEAYIQELTQERQASKAANEQAMADLETDYATMGCPDSGVPDCAQIEQALEQIRFIEESQANEFALNKSALENFIACLLGQMQDEATCVAELDAEVYGLGSFLSWTLLERYEQLVARTIEMDAKSQQHYEEYMQEMQRILDECTDDASCAPWKLVRQGTEVDAYSAECLIGWIYDESGDIVIDDSLPARGARIIGLKSKPEHLLVQKNGDVIADGVKIARIALCSLVNKSFSSLSDVELPDLLIHPKYIGNKRIFHVMTEGYKVSCLNPASLRNEIVRHEALPYPIGNYFQKDPCIEHEETCEDKHCCENPDLPDCFDIDGCPVTIPQWFKDWYDEHREYLFIKLPYDGRYEGDPIRYTHNEQIMFAKALIDLIVRYFDSTPFSVTNGFENWQDMKRILNILPVLKKDRPSARRFDFAGWSIGTNSNSPSIEFPVVQDSSTMDFETCSDCDVEPLDEEIAFDDCCESACGRWSQECDYSTGDIVFSVSGEFCYRALVDVCAGECNPEPGTAGSEEIWFNCTPDCETTAPSAGFSVSNNYICLPEACNPIAGVALVHEPLENTTSCEYRWIYTATNINVPEVPPVVHESFGRHPKIDGVEGDVNYSLLKLPMLPEGCSDNDSSYSSFEPNLWSVRLEARSAISDEVLSSSVIEPVAVSVECNFSINIWDGEEASIAQALNWCDEAGGENPHGQRASAPDSQLGSLFSSLEETLEEATKAIDIYPGQAPADLKDLPDGIEMTGMLSSRFSDVFVALAANPSAPQDVQLFINSQLQLLSCVEDINAGNPSNGCYQEPMDMAEKLFSDYSDQYSNTGCDQQNPMSDECKWLEFAIREMNHFRQNEHSLWVFRYVYNNLKNYFKDESIYIGVEDCCCVVLKPDAENATSCDMSWVWLVSTDSMTWVPYYGGIGLQPEETVVCAMRNPINDQNETRVEAVLLSYASTCDDYVQSAVNNWDGQPWNQYFSPQRVCECFDSIFISCDCVPPQGYANIDILQCDDDTLKWSVKFLHLNYLNKYNSLDCLADWRLQVVASDGAVVYDLTRTNVPEFSLSGDGDIISLPSDDSYTFNLTSSKHGVSLFNQDVYLPACPRLDLGSSFTGGVNDFSETDYGEFNYNYSSNPVVLNERNLPNSVAIESPSFSVQNDDPLGSFSIYVTHEPDSNDPHWLAVDGNAYQWVWRVNTYNPQSSTPSFVDVPVGYVSSSNDYPNGRAGSLSYQHHVQALGEEYSIDLIATNLVTGESTVASSGRSLNPKYSGERTWSVSVPTQSVNGVENFSWRMAEEWFEMTPTTNYDGVADVNFELIVSLGGTPHTIIPLTIQYRIASDPCLPPNPLIINDSGPVYGSEAITMDYSGGETTAEVSHNIILSQYFADECFMKQDLDGDGTSDLAFSPIEEVYEYRCFDEMAYQDQYDDGTPPVEPEWIQISPFGGGHYGQNLVERYFNIPVDWVNPDDPHIMRLDIRSTITATDNPSVDGSSDVTPVVATETISLTNPFSLCPSQSGYRYYAVNPAYCVTEGCTDPLADNYNPNAVIDFGCCYTPKVNSDSIIENYLENFIATSLADHSLFDVSKIEVTNPENNEWVITLKDGFYKLSDDGGNNLGYSETQIDVVELFNATIDSNPQTAEFYYQIVTYDQTDTNSGVVEPGGSYLTPTILIDDVHEWIDIQGNMRMTPRLKEFPAVIYTRAFFQNQPYGCQSEQIQIVIRAEEQNYTIICGDPTAPNYTNPANTGNPEYGFLYVDNSICQEYGCTDPLADNYDQNADVDDGSCNYTAPLLDGGAEGTLGSLVESSSVVAGSDSLTITLDQDFFSNSPSGNGYDKENRLEVDDIKDLIDFSGTTDPDPSNWNIEYLRSDFGEGNRFTNTHISFNYGGTNRQRLTTPIDDLGNNTRTYEVHNQTLTWNFTISHVSGNTALNYDFSITSILEDQVFSLDGVEVFPLGSLNANGRWNGTNTNAVFAQLQEATFQQDGWDGLDAFVFNEPYFGDDAWEFSVVSNTSNTDRHIKVTLKDGFFKLKNYNSSNTTSSGGMASVIKTFLFRPYTFFKQGVSGFNTDLSISANRGAYSNSGTQDVTYSMQFDGNRNMTTSDISLESASALIYSNGTVRINPATNHSERTITITANDGIRDAVLRITFELEAQNYTAACLDTSKFEPTTQDGSYYHVPAECVDKVFGCTDDTMYNYDASANTDDQSCYPVIVGCMDPTAANYVNPTGDTGVDINTADNSMCCYTPTLKSSSDIISSITTTKNNINTSPMNDVDRTKIVPTFANGEITVTVKAGALTYPRNYTQSSGGYVQIDLDDILTTYGQTLTYTCDISANSNNAAGSPGISLSNKKLNLRFGEYTATRSRQLNTALGGTTLVGREYPSVQYTVNVAVTDCAEANTSFIVNLVLEPHVYESGCTDSNATNHDAGVLLDDNSCCYVPQISMTAAGLLTMARDRKDEDAAITDDNKVDTSVSGNTGTIEFESGFFKNPAGGVGYEDLVIKLDDLFSNPWSGSTPSELANDEMEYTWVVNFYDANGDLVTVANKSSTKSGSDLISGGSGSWKAGGTGNEISSSESGATNDQIQIQLDGNLTSAHNGLALFDDIREISSSSCGYPAIVNKAVVSVTAKYAASSCKTETSEILTIEVLLRDHVTNSIKCCLDSDLFTGDGWIKGGMSLSGYKDFWTGAPNGTDFWSHIIFKNEALRLKGGDQGMVPGYGKFDCASLVGVPHYGAYEENANPSGSEAAAAFIHLYENAHGIVAAESLSQAYKISGKPESGVFPAVSIGDDITLEIRRLLVELIQGILSNTDCASVNLLIESYAARIEAVGNLRAKMCGRSLAYFKAIISEARSQGFDAGLAEELMRIIETGLDSKGQPVSWATVVGMTGWKKDNIVKWLVGSLQRVCGACPAGTGVPTKATVGGGGVTTFIGGTTVLIEVPTDWSLFVPS